MKLAVAKKHIEKLANIPFKEYLSTEQIQDAMLIINKGKTGQLLELTIGLELSSSTLDFEDGELKTNKCTVPANLWKPCLLRRQLLSSTNC